MSELEKLVIKFFDSGMKDFSGKERIIIIKVWVG